MQKLFWWGKKSISFLTILSIVATIATPFVLYPTSVAHAAEEIPAPICTPQEPQIIVSNETTAYNAGYAVLVSSPSQYWISGELLHPDAKWIWGEDPANTPVDQSINEVFTKSFVINGTPTASTLEIATDDDYSVKVNNQDFSCQGDSSSLHFQNAETCNIPANILTTGSNSIEFTITNSFFEYHEDELNPGGLLYKLTVNENNCSTPPNPATLTIIKNTDSTGEEGTFDFSVVGTTDGASATQSQPLTTENHSASWENISLNPGSYDVLETIAGGWQLADVSCIYDNESVGSITPPTLTQEGKSISVDSDDHVICTFTNTKRAVIVVKKNIINDNGGTKTAADFSFKMNDEDAVSFEADGQNNVIVDGGTYNITESADEGYATTYEGCENISIENGQKTICTITNNDLPATLTIIKKTNGEGSGTFNFSITATGDTVASPQSTSLTPNEGNNFTAETLEDINLAKGTYDITETGQPGWHLSDISCQYDNQSFGNSDIVLGIKHLSQLDNGDHVTCTFTNTKKGTLIVNKVVVNDNGGTKVATNFSFTINGSETSTAFLQNGENALLGQNTMVVNAGNYTITEPQVAGYATTLSEGCTNVNIATGGQGVCTITNNDIQPKLTITKVVVNNNGGNKTISDFPLFVGETQVDSGIQNAFNAGTYTIHETNQANYSGTISGDCAANGSITLAAGDVKTCTITNDDTVQQGSGGSSSGGGGGGGVVLNDGGNNIIGNAVFKPGDINHDGKVDELDFAILMADWGKTGALNSDLNHDGTVNEIDLAILMFNFGK